MRVAGICRKSPGKKIETSIDVQEKSIMDWCERNLRKRARIDWFVDKEVSGDDPHRPELKKLFASTEMYDYAVALNVDRYARSWLGIKWFFENFTTDGGRSPHKGCRLCFISEVPSLYDDSGMLDENSFFIFGIMCMKAQAELMAIRQRTQRGRERMTEEEWRQKFTGRKKGSKNKNKR